MTESDLLRFGLQAGQAINIKTASGRTVLGRLARLEGEGQADGQIHLDRFLRQALKVQLHDEVVVAGVSETPVRKLKLLPSIDVFDAHHLDRHVLHSLVESRSPVALGSILYVPFPASVAGTTYKVVGLDDGPGIVTAETELQLEYNQDFHTDAVADVTFDDVGGMRREIDLLRELLQLPLQQPEVYRQIGINPPRGIVLHGPPGAGKTHLARALANEVNARFYYVNGPEVVGTMYGETESNIRRVFNEATHHAPSVILIDELDSIAPRRGQSGSQSDTRMVTQILSLMDGLTRVDGVIVVGTTNRLEDIDAALRRPGRFDREIFIGPPDVDGRLEILEIHTREMPLTDDAIDHLPTVARLTPGFVGADLMEVCREAGLSALRRNAEPWPASASVNPERLSVNRADFEVARTKIRPSAIREVLVTVPEVTWQGIGGLAEVKAKLRRLVELPLTRANQFKALRLRPPSGLLLHGPPGCGKTLLAKAVANECKANFIAVEGPEIFTKWLGESEEMVRRIFRVARQLAPAIVFFDQLDAVASLRGVDSGSKTSERVVSQLLVELDGIETLGDVLVIGATNRLELIDESVLRPGRLGTHIYVPLPDASDREAIARIHLSGLTALSEQETETMLQAVVDATDGCSGAQIKALCDEAKLLAIEESLVGRTPTLTPHHLAMALSNQSELFSQDRRLPALSAAVVQS